MQISKKNIYLRTYYVTTTILSVPFKIIFENKSDSSQRRFAKKDEGNE